MKEIYELTDWISGRPIDILPIHYLMLKSLGCIKSRLIKNMSKEHFVSKKGYKIWHNHVKPNWDFAFRFEIDPFHRIVYCFATKMEILNNLVGHAKFIHVISSVKFKRVRCKFHFLGKSKKAFCAEFRYSDLGDGDFDEFSIMDAFGFKEIQHQLEPIFLRVINPHIIDYENKSAN